MKWLNEDVLGDLFSQLCEYLAWRGVAVQFATFDELSFEIGDLPELVDHLLRRACVDVRRWGWIWHGEDPFGWICVAS